MMLSPVLNVNRSKQSFFDAVREKSLCFTTRCSVANSNSVAPVQTMLLLDIKFSTVRTSTV